MGSDPFPLPDPVIYELTGNRLARGTNDIHNDW